MAKKAQTVKAQAVKKVHQGKAVKRRVRREIVEASENKSERIDDLIQLRRQVKNADSLTPAQMKRVFLALIDQIIIEAGED